MPLASNALTTLPAVKEYLKLQDTTVEDSLLETLINSASTLIEGYCSRRFREQAYIDEEYDGSGSASIVLSQYPVSSIQGMKIDGGEVGASEYKARKETGILLRLNSTWPEGVLNISVSYTAGYSQIPEDLELACKHLVMFYYKTDIADFSRTFGEGFVLRPEALPVQVKALLASYRKVLI
jgi:uncharacterized phiE125 gp8 family phage protein